MNKMKHILSMAALVLMGAVMTGCSSDDNLDNPKIAGKGNVETLKTTVNLDGKAATRALTANGVKTFAAGEKMALVYKNTGGSFVKVESEALTTGDIATGGKTATFTFTIENPDKTYPVNYIYPAAMANDDGSFASLAAQDGTLATLASDFDLCSDLEDWDNGDLPATTLENRLAILALTLKDNGGNDITNTITTLAINDGTNAYGITRTPAAGPIYVAIQPTASANISILAGNISTLTRYNKELTSKTYVAGSGTWTNSVYAGITCAGDATIILADRSANTVKGFHEDYPGIHVPSGYTLTIQGTGSLTASGNGFSAGIASIGTGDGGYCNTVEIGYNFGYGETRVTAIKGENAQNCIGKGYNGYCYEVVIDNEYDPTPSTTTIGIFNSTITTTNYPNDTWELTYVE